MSDALRSSLTLNVGASNGHEGHKEPTNSCAAISNKVVKSSKLLTSPQLLPLLPPGQQVSNVTTVIPTSNAKKGASSPSTAFEFLTFKWLFKRRSGQGVTNSSSTLNVGRNRRSGQANISRATTNVSIANGQSSGPLPRIKKLSTATCLNALLEPAKKCTKGSEEASTRSPMKASYSFDDIDRLLQSTPVHREKNRRDKKKERVNKYKSNVDLANFRTFDKYQVRSFRDDVSLEEYEEDDDELDEGRSMVTPSLRRNCKLCLGQRPISNFHTIWSCGCSFCRPCLSTYLTYAVRENMNVPHIECPDSDCPRSKRPLAADVLTASGRKASTTAIRRHVLTALGQHKSSSSSNLVGDRNLDNVFSAQEVQLLVDEITFELFKKLKVEYEVDRDPCRVWCPKANCDTICVVTKPTVTCVTDTNPRARTRTASDPLRMSGWPVYCSRCDKTFCNDCRKPWHSGFPCSEPTEDDLLMLLQREGSLPNGETGPEIKRCPRCSVWIERDEGCAQMMCRKCKHVFCWFCLQSLEDDFLLRHYDKGPCKNKLGHTRASVIWHRTQVIGIFAGFGILLLLASPLFLLAAPCILCCNCCCSSPCKYLDDDEEDEDIEIEAEHDDHDDNGYNPTASGSSNSHSSRGSISTSITSKRDDVVSKSDHELIASSSLLSSRVGITHV